MDELQLTSFIFLVWGCREGLDWPVAGCYSLAQPAERRTPLLDIPFLEGTTEELLMWSGLSISEKGTEAAVLVRWLSAELKGGQPFSGLLPKDLSHRKLLASSGQRRHVSVHGGMAQGKASTT